MPVKYGSDLRRAREILNRVAHDVVGDYARGAEEAWRRLVQRYLIEDSQVTPMVTLVANDNWVELTLRYVLDYKRRRTTEDLLFTRVLEEVDATAGGVALASATFQLVEAPVLDVRLTQEPRP